METSNTLSNNLWSYFQKRLLESAEKTLHLAKFGMTRQQPKGMGSTYQILKYGNITPDTNTLTEGVVPTESSIATNKYTVTLLQYGKYISYSDFLAFTALDDVSTSLADRLGYEMGLQKDSVIRDNLIANATTSTQYVGTGNTTDNDIAATEVFTAADFIKPVRVLRSGDAPSFDSDGCYVGVIDGRIEMDIMADTSAGGFIELNKYVSGLSEKPLRGEVGKVYGCRLVTSTNTTSATNSGAVNVYRVLVLAKDAFVVVNSGELTTELINFGPGTGGTSDPLKQKGTCGYKACYGVKYLGGTFSNANGASPDLCIQLRGAATGG